MERTAFNRAWRYLNYRPVAKWTAWGASVVTAVLYLALLCVLGLFADLLVSRGQIPSFSSLTQREREAFQSAWDAGAGVDSDKEGRATRLNERTEQLLRLRLGEQSAAELAAADFDRLSPAEKELIWRSYVYRVLETRVGANAASLVLPAYRDLPASAQGEFHRKWSDLSRRERDDRLESLGTTTENLSIADVAAVGPDQKEIFWRAYVLGELSNAGSSTAYSRDRTTVADADTNDAPELADRGVLSLVVRSNNWPLSGIYGPVLGGVAKWNPWMWRTRTATWPNYVFYLTWLLIVALVLAVLRALAMYVMHYFAAVATIEASNRLRRAVYHHTYRLGTLAFRALGPSEAVGIFARRSKRYTTDYTPGSRSSCGNR